MPRYRLRYVRDRLRNYSGRYVVVMVDLRVHWSLVGPVFLTRRKTLAVRNEIHMSLEGGLHVR